MHAVGKGLALKGDVCNGYNVFFKNLLQTTLIFQILHLCCQKLECHKCGIEEMCFILVTVIEQSIW